MADRDAEQRQRQRLYVGSPRVRVKVRELLEKIPYRKQVRP
jgi:hypothetical protein